MNKVSIILPTYNRIHLLRETLNSIFYQNFENWECIIVDDDSSENVFEIVQEFILKDSRFVFYSRPENLPKGANSCRNYGFEKASGDFIQWFDSDDIMLEDFLSTKLIEFTEDIEMVITSGYIWNSEKETKEAKKQEGRENEQKQTNKTLCIDTRRSPVFPFISVFRITLFPCAGSPR